MTVHSELHVVSSHERAKSQQSLNAFKFLTANACIGHFPARASLLPTENAGNVSHKNSPITHIDRKHTRRNRGYRVFGLDSKRIYSNVSRESKHIFRIYIDRSKIYPCNGIASFEHETCSTSIVSLSAFQ